MRISWEHGFGGDGGTGSHKRSNGVNGGNEETHMSSPFFSVGFVAPFLKSGTSISLRCRDALAVGVFQQPAECGSHAFLAEGFQ